MELDNSFVRELAGKFTAEEIQNGWEKIQAPKFESFYGDGLREEDGSPKVMWHNSTNLETFDNFDKKYLYSAPGRGYLNLGAGFYFGDYDHVKWMLDNVTIPLATEKDADDDVAIRQSRERRDYFNSLLEKSKNNHEPTILKLSSEIEKLEDDRRASFLKQYPNDPFDEGYKDINTVIKELNELNAFQRTFSGKNKKGMIKLGKNIDILNFAKTYHEGNLDVAKKFFERRAENEQNAIKERLKEIEKNNYAKAFFQPFLSNARYLDWNGDVPEDLLEMVRSNLENEDKSRFDYNIGSITDGCSLYKQLAKAILNKDMNFGEGYVTENALPVSDFLLSVGIGGNSNYNGQNHCYVVFNENTIKHALHNNGNFDTSANNFYT